MNPQVTQGYQPILQPDGVDYKFITRNDIVYDALFSTAEEFFPGMPWADDVLMFALAPEKGFEPSEFGDPDIGHTAAAIAETKFNQNKALILLWVYAVKDKRELLRLRKFNGIAMLHNTAGRYTKVDFADTQKNIYGAMVYRTDNPAALQIKAQAQLLPTRL